LEQVENIVSGREKAKSPMFSLICGTYTYNDDDDVLYECICGSILGVSRRGDE
jgi:hypothetical protein